MFPSSSATAIQQPNLQGCGAAPPPGLLSIGVLKSHACLSCTNRVVFSFLDLVRPSKNKPASVLDFSGFLQPVFFFFFWHFLYYYFLYKIHLSLRVDKEKCVFIGGFFCTAEA